MAVETRHRRFPRTPYRAFERNAHGGLRYRSATAPDGSFMAPSWMGSSAFLTSCAIRVYDGGKMEVCG